MSQRPKDSITLFYSYAHADEKLRLILEKHLSLLQSRGLITAWHDRQIVPGANWSQTIDHHLNSASIILLLISPDFLASNYCYNIEMRRALERHKRGEAQVIPVILRPVDWHNAPFAHLQCLPRDGKPVTTWKNRDAAFRDVAEGIRRAIEHSIRAAHSLSIPTEFAQSSPSKRVNQLNHPLHQALGFVSPLSRRRFVWGFIAGTALLGGGTLVGYNIYKSNIPAIKSFQAKSVITIADNLSDVIGCQYNREHDQLVFTEFGGNLSVIDGATSTSPQYRVLGNGYGAPGGIAVTSNMKTAYVADHTTDQRGRVQRVDLTNPNGANKIQSVELYSTAQNVAIDQMALDEARGEIYFVEADAGDGSHLQTYTGSLIRFRLATSEKTVLSRSLIAPLGFIISSDYQMAYTTEAQVLGKENALVRYDLKQGTRTVLTIGTGFFFCAWGNDDQTAIILPDRNLGYLWYVDLTTTPAEKQLIASTSLLPSPPSTVAITSSKSLFPLLVCCRSTIVLLK